MRHIHFRALLAAGALLVATAACGGQGGTSETAEKTLTWASTGGQFQEDEKNALQKPFTAATGTTFVNVSPAEAVFNTGRVERLGTPADLYRDPGTRFVARFLGESNLFPGHLRPGGVYEWSGHTWAVPGAEGGQGGQGDRDLVVRPERLGVAVADADVPPGANRVTATVTAVSFQGTHQRLELDYGAGATGCAVLPPDGLEEVRPGSSVIAHWRPAHQVLVTRDVR